MNEGIIQTQKTDGRFLAEMQTFLIVWLGQVISLLGSSMTGFALGVWVFQETGSATGFALTLLFNMLPKTVLAPVAGISADRYDRRLIMMLMDLSAGLATMVTAVLFLNGHLAVWHIYLLTALNASASAFQGTAFGAAVTQLVPKAYFGRANGFIPLGTGVGLMAAPILAGLLIAGYGLGSVLLVDMATFLFAVFTLLRVRFPAYGRPADSSHPEKESWDKQVWRGWCYLWTRPGLLGLVLIFALGNFFVGIAQAVSTPLILTFASPDTLALILSAGGLGMLAGSLVMGMWGGGQRKVIAVFGAYCLLGAAVFMAGLSPSVPLLTAAFFLAHFFVPIGIGASQAILQAKVVPEVQGRVFSLRLMLNTLSFSVAFLIGGPLADGVFEPLMAAGGLLSGTVGQLIGVGPGRGMGLMFVVMGLLALATAVSAFAYPRIRNVESELPDWVA